MRYIASIVIAICLLFSVSLVPACGEDKVERGLTVDREVSSPDSPEEMAETEKERAEELTEDLQAESEKPFDALQEK